ncbi:MAG: adenylosuccinate lyase [Microbacterium sp.]|uniref:lyase family protein n=1 Tax=Microbacterium sp. TaxID=51671 RepID=UPI00282BD4CD|nr:lyase family protein [Microbacterium sp.]MDR2320894.1 adenylosuccinate lyase [Microbacterium sp.]
MPTDDETDSALGSAVFGLLDPLLAGSAAGARADGETAIASDAHVAAALVRAERGLLTAYGDLGVMPPARAERVAPGFRPEVRALAAAALESGNPVVPLVDALRRRTGDADAALWIHRGATSQDILDTALMLVAKDGIGVAVEDLAAAASDLVAQAVAHRDDPAAARTLGQHAVPITVGARIAGRLRALVRARRTLLDAAAALPAQLGGAAGTQASFVELFGSEIASRLPSAFAAATGLVAPPAPWHTDRYPILDLAHAAGAALAAMGALAADVVTLTRPEIAEASVQRGGGSSTMPQKRNPVDAVLLRSAAMRAPALIGQLHTAAGLAGDERPDGAWHAEWPALQELLRLLVGAAARTRELCEGLRFDAERARENLALTGGLILSERLALVLKPRIGAARFAEVIDRAAAGESLADLVRALPEVAEQDLADLLDPARYLGRSGALVDDAVRTARDEGIR